MKINCSGGILPSFWLTNCISGQISSQGHAAGYGRTQQRTQREENQMEVFGSLWIRPVSIWDPGLVLLFFSGLPSKWPCSTPRRRWHGSVPRSFQRQTKMAYCHSSKLPKSFRLTLIRGSNHLLKAVVKGGLPGFQFYWVSTCQHGLWLLCEIPLRAQQHSWTAIPDSNLPAAWQPGFCLCWQAAQCSDSLVSVESASESASSGCSNITDAVGDQAMFMRFHNTLILIKHRQIIVD